MGKGGVGWKEGEGREGGRQTDVSSKWHQVLSKQRHHAHIHLSVKGNWYRSAVRILTFRKFLYSK